MQIPLWIFTLPTWVYITLGVLIAVSLVCLVAFAPSIFTRDCISGISALLAVLRGVPGVNQTALKKAEKTVENANTAFQRIEEEIPRRVTDISQALNINTL
jgi:hypothetical protein